ncbi:MAG TPA: DUF2249 domain-containing protein [Nevskiaceae bacterium]|nr:DUF2249 domain-containing protein [Nevskiaceae bacterium]
MAGDLNPEENVHVFDARGIAHRFRHSAIFGALGALHSGETMRFTNDHDPLPLLAQIQERFGDHVTISYRSREPGEVVIDFGVTGLSQG